MKLVKTLALMGLLLMFSGLAMLCLSLYSQKPHNTTLNPRYPTVGLSPAQINTIANFTVLISDEGLMGVGRGTGVLIDDNTVLSCAHMMPREGAEMWVYTHPLKEVRKAQLKYFDETDDLALFTLDHPVHLVHYPVFQPIVFEGQPITVMGNILGSMKWFVSYGIISGTFNQYLLTDALTRGGNSGGAWVNNKGEIVAITDWGLQDSKGNELGIHGGVSASTILAFLKDAKHPNIFKMLFGE